MVITPPIFPLTIGVLKIQTNVVTVNDIGVAGNSWRLHIGDHRDVTVSLGWGPNNQIKLPAGSVRVAAVLRWTKGGEPKEQREDLVFTVPAKPE